MRGDDRPGDREAEPYAAAVVEPVARTAPERLEQAGDLLASHPRAGVRHRQAS